jgi:hypothetical protein
MRHSTARGVSLWEYVLDSYYSHPLPTPKGNTSPRSNAISLNRSRS